MLGATTVPRPGVTTHNVREPSLTADQESELTDRLNRCRHGIDRVSTEISERFAKIDRGNAGVPESRSHFTAVVGYGDVTGPAALEIRNCFYPDAVVANGITMDPEQLFKTLKAPELGAHRTSLQSRTFSESDLVFAHGIKSERDAARIAASRPGAVSVPSLHSFIPGTDSSHQPGDLWDGTGTMNILMLGRMGDPNKGAADTAKAIEGLRNSHGKEIHLTLRGIPEAEREDFEDSMDANLRPDWRSFVTVQSFTDSEEEKERSIRDSHAMVMATESEAYGLASGEYLAHGKPLLVTEGNGNGYTEVLKSWEGMPERARMLVIDDSNTRSTQGNAISPADPTVLPSASRHVAISEKIADLHDNYYEYLQSTREACAVLEHYNKDHMAQSLDQAVTERHDGIIRHTRQTADGGLRPTHDHEITAGLPEHLHGVALNPSAPGHRDTADPSNATPPQPGHSPAAVPQRRPTFLASSTAASTTGQARASGDAAEKPPQHGSRNPSLHNRKGHSTSR
ncbi:hypothetical protein GCM10007147_33850 [Nocardiopsis kunsanensis]|uniref:Glycosyltransferase n=2 Tax=Nocardiopsis kunsanensis TaxID=141693 RepID=A0A918XHR0_9ACTN|nr:hypothetical protein GCM10007147_33850 [Nocardiopsis kunsanensis]